MEIFAAASTIARRPSTSAAAEPSTRQISAADPKVTAVSLAEAVAYSLTATHSTASNSTFLTWALDAQSPSATVFQSLSAVALTWTW